MTRDGTVSVVVPTYNRARALESNLPQLFALLGVAEFVIVVDGSTDDTLEVLGRFDDSRLKVIRQAQHGAPAARNAGVDRSSGEWLLVVDDDDLFPTGFVTRLLAVAEREKADIVGTPWVDVGPEGLEETLRRLNSARTERRDLETHPRTFPMGTIETPFLSNTAIVHRRVFGKVRYDSSYAGNAWREETGFFLSAAEAGFKVVLTDETYAYHLQRYTGGQHRPGLGYEYWLVRNNWRFLRRHRRWLQTNAGMGSVVSSQLRFITGRVAAVARGRLRRHQAPKA